MQLCQSKIMFRLLKEAIQRRFDELVTNETHIFYKDVDRDKIWDVYLNAFPNETRQEHNCNSCKSFLRQFSGIVFIKANKVESIWDIDLEPIDEEYHRSITTVRDYITGLPITNVFLTETKKLGNAQNLDKVRDIVWEHFSLTLNTVRTVKIGEIASKQSLYRSSKEVLKRALNELTIDALETVLDLIAQNSLYKGKEFEEFIKGFYQLKKKYDLLPNEQKDPFAWHTSVHQPSSNNIRNSAVGTLLVNLSEEMELDAAVRKYEAVVAPTNYKRPTALVSPKMIEEAKKKIEELGYMDSLERRFAMPTDLNINDILFTDKTSGVTDVFQDLAKEALINPKTLSKVEEITISDFIEKVIPTAKSIEVLLEQKHLPNLVSLLTAQHPEAPVMFKWSNPFSWAYTGGITDSLKERVKDAGGNVDGVLRFSIQWNDVDTPGIVDFDAHAYEPAGKHIMYSAGYRKDSGNIRTPMSGQLDVDMVGRSGEPEIRVENITWTDLSKMRSGEYRLDINNFNGNRNKGFKAQIEFAGQTYDFHYPVHLSGSITVATVTLKDGAFTLSSDLNSNSTITSKEKWGVRTNQFTKVKNILLSPNYWQQAIGNKHFMFILEDCLNDEPVRPFFNEFLKQELNDHRKVFEVLAGKLTVASSPNQLSGVGFSDTQPNSLIVRVTGTFKRDLKINF